MNGADVIAHILKREGTGFLACYPRNPLIEACAARHNVHIHKHQRVRSILEENPEVFEGKTDAIWRAFQKIENQIRPGQIYGGKMDGKALQKAKKLFEEIEEICLERI